MQRVLVTCALILIAISARAEPNVMIDDRVGIDLDMPRLHRLLRLVGDEIPPSLSVAVTIHIWPREQIEPLSVSGADRFFVQPNQIYIPDADYQSILQGILMAAFPGENDQRIEDRSRMIWYTSLYVVEAPK